MPRIQNSRTCGSGYCLACARRGSGMWSNTSSSDAIRAPSIGFPKCHSAPSSRHPWENRTALLRSGGQGLKNRLDRLEGYDPAAVSLLAQTCAELADIGADVQHHIDIVTAQPTLLRATH